MTARSDLPAIRPSRAQLRDHLVATMIAGEVATPRQSNLLHFRRLANDDPYYKFGLTFGRRLTEADVLAVMVERCGVDPDPMHLYGDDTIDPELTLDALEAMGERIGRAARDRETVVLATGHPHTLTGLYEDIARALTDVGCRVLRPAEGWSYQVRDWAGKPESQRIRYAPEGVATIVNDHGRPLHTHDPDPMEAMLAELRAASPGETGSAAIKPEIWPDLAIADHGWAGAAGEAGIDTVGFADCNDPALFLGAAEGKIDVVVPLDDGVPADRYRPMTAFLLAKAGLVE